MLKISTKAGDERLFRYRNVLRREAGERPYVIGFALDETERVRAELALRQSEERHRSVVETAFDAFVSMDASGRITAWNPQAERTFGWSRGEALGRLLAETITHTMVHDLRSPLTWVLGSLEVLETTPDAPLTAPQQALLRGVRSGAESILALVNSILDVFRLEQGALPLDQRALVLGDVVGDVVALAAPLARDKALRIVQEIPPDLPALWADPQVVTRVLQNLLGNAIKFTPAEGVVRLSAAAESASWVRVAVSDSGPGVPDEVRPRLFQKFAAGSQKGRGSGLGLAFCRLAVEALGGKIWLEDDPGRRGATFVLTLPAAPAAG